MIRRAFVPSLIAAIGVIGLAGCMQQQSTMAAKTVTYKAHLTAKDEVPPNASTATGDGTFVFNPATKELSWDVTFSGLSGPALASHIHGPGEPGKNADVLILFEIPKAPAGAIKGNTFLVTEQVNDLQAGKYYVNIHTAANKGGEIRGQLMP
jgi:CHRD domain-containing protein